MNSSHHNLEITRYIAGKSNRANDCVAVESPLQITILQHIGSTYIEKDISITMRTPGQDKELAIGFLYTEGIILSIDAIASAIVADNKVIITIKRDIPIDLSKLERNFYTSSSCGVCGKSSIDSIKIQCPIYPCMDQHLIIDADILLSLPDRLRKEQDNFNSTGAIHAVGLFDSNGDIVKVMEDVGRHNALDKLVGWALLNSVLPFSSQVILLSGRASFELIQKGAMAGAEFISAVGAPSSLAIELAQENNITLIGFLRKDRFNIYNGEERLNIE